MIGRRRCIPVLLAALALWAASSLAAQTPRVATPVTSDAAPLATRAEGLVEQVTTLMEILEDLLETKGALSASKPTRPAAGASPEAVERWAYEHDAWEQRMQEVLVRIGDVVRELAELEVRLAALCDEIAAARRQAPSAGDPVRDRRLADLGAFTDTLVVRVKELRTELEELEGLITRPRRERDLQATAVRGRVDAVQAAAASLPADGGVP